jgi:hypothetical protein
VNKGLGGEIASAFICTVGDRGPPVFTGFIPGSGNGSTKALRSPINRLLSCSVDECGFHAIKSFEFLESKNIREVVKCTVIGFPHFFPAFWEFNWLLAFPPE